MATRSKPLISAALASAAAIAVVSPTIAPNIGVPTPGALSKAAYELVNFKDVLSIPAVTWTDVLFGNDYWGGTLGPDSYGPDSVAPQSAFGQLGYVNPWAVYCDNTCTRSGIPGALYMFFDALVNGQGKGYDNYEDWKIGLVNYYFEPNAVFQLGNGSSPQIQYVDAGLSSGSWYLLQTTIGKLVPSLTVPLAGAYWGPQNVPVFYNFGLSIAALAAGSIPLVGPLIGNTLLAYLGDLALGQGVEQTYQYGFSGALNYVIDLATGAVPFPTKVPWYAINPGAALKAPAATVVAAAASTEAPEAPESTPAADAPQSTPAADVLGSTPAADAPERTPAADVLGSTPAADAPESTPAADAPESTPVEDAPSADVPAAEVADSAPTQAAPKRPLRDAVSKVTKQIGSAFGGGSDNGGKHRPARHSAAKAAQ